MKESNKESIKINGLYWGLLLGLAGWLSWLYVFWYILFFPSSQGYYLNPFKFHEFWIEFILINFIVIFFIALIKLHWSEIFGK